MSLLLQLLSTSASPKHLLWEPQCLKESFQSPLMLVPAWTQCSPGCAGSCFRQLQSWASSKATSSAGWEALGSVLGATLLPVSHHLLLPCCAGISPLLSSCPQHGSLPNMGPVPSSIPKLSNLASESFAISSSRVCFPLSRLPFNLLFGQSTLPFAGMAMSVIQDMLELW